MDSAVLLLLLSSMSMCLAVGAAVYLGYIDLGFLPGASRKPPGNDAPLPLPPWKKGGAPWNISWANNPQRVSTSGDELRIDFQSGKFSGESGAQFRANPFGKLPATRASLSYEVFIPSGFPWTLGGKLGPGFCIGESAGRCSTGGDWDNASGSIRVTWNGRKKGAMGYVYIPLQVGSGNRTKVVAAQSSEFGKVAQVTSGGIHLWHDNPFPLQEGRWNRISVQVGLNDPGKNNGYLRMFVNGQSKTMNSMVWRTTTKLKLTDVLFASFFGGGSSDWAPSRDTYLKYRSFGFSAS
jgi:hypothetical protein